MICVMWKVWLVDKTQQQLAAFSQWKGCDEPTVTLPAQHIAVTERLRFCGCWRWFQSLKESQYWLDIKRTRGQLDTNSLCVSVWADFTELNLYVFSLPLAKPPVFGPSKQLDIELEMVSFVFTSSNQLYVCNVWTDGKIT